MLFVDWIADVYVGVMDNRLHIRLNEMKPHN